MARNYRFDRHKEKAIPQTGTPVFSVGSFDGDQSPTAYCKTIKVSLTPTDVQSNNPASYMVCASTSADPADTADIFTAASVPDGGGTVWLSCKRRILDAVEDTSRPDGPIYILVYSQGIVPTRMHCEAWGKYLNLLTL